MKENILLQLKENRIIYEALCKRLFKEHNIIIQSPDELAQSIPPSSPNILQQLFSFQADDDFFILAHENKFNNAEHIHDFFELVYMVKGTAKEYINHELVTLSEGDICIHVPHSTHIITEFNENDSYLINILISKNAFRQAYYKPLLRDSSLNYFFSRFTSSAAYCPSYIHFTNLSPQIDILMELICSEYLRNDDNSRIICNGYFLAFWGELLRNENTNSKAAEISNYLACNLEDISLKKAASHFGYHEKYFGQIVSKETGKSFQNLLTEVRLSKAASLLSYTNLSIEEISNIVGYKDVSSLYINFSKYFHATPASYRKDNLFSR